MIIEMTTLMTLSNQTNANEIQKILQTGASIDWNHSDIHKIVFNAIKVKNNEFFQVIMNEGMDYSTIIDDEGNSVLHIAAGSNNTEITQLILETGFPINVLNINGSSPLMEAAICNAEDTFIQLLSAGADIIVDGSELMLWDLMNVSLKISFPKIFDEKVRLEKRLGINTDFYQTHEVRQTGINSVTEYDSNMYAHLTRKEKMDAIKLLLELEKPPINIIKGMFNDFDIDVNEPFANNGQRLLHMATEKNNIYSMYILFELGADINLAMESNKNTPLHIAADSLMVEALRLLIEAGAEVDVEDDMQFTPILTSTLSDCDYDIIAIELLLAGADDRGYLDAF